MKPLILIILLSWHTILIGQATASFTASVTIIEPVSIVNEANMNFASISARAGGKVVLSPDDERYATGGLTLEEAQGVSAAKFLIKGEEGMTVAISLPKDLYQLSNGEQNISLHSFTSNMPASFQLGRDPVPLKVGATIDIENSMASGVYRSGHPMAVTVNYN